MVKAFTNEFYEVNRYSEALQDSVKTALRAANYRGAFISFVVFAIFGGIVGVLWYGSNLVAQGKNVILGCSAWKDRVNMEDTLFAGAVVSRIREHFQVFCDASQAAEILYRHAQIDTWNVIKNTTHFHRLSAYGLEKDMQWCISIDVANVLPIYKDGVLVVHAD